MPVAAKHKKVLIFGLLPALAVLITLTAACYFLVLEQSPLTPADREIDTHDFDRVERLMRRIQYTLDGRRPSTSVVATASDLDSLAIFAARSVKGMASEVRISPEKVVFLATYELLHRPVRRYVNVALAVRQSTSGLDVMELDVGHIHLGARLARFFVDRAFEQVLGKKLGADLLDAIGGIAINGDVVTLMLRPNPTIEARIKDRLTNATAAVDPSTVSAYYRQIMRIAEPYDRLHQVPFVDFLQPLLTMAADRSRHSDPVIEMRGVVFALAIYFGGHRLDEMRESLLPADLAKLPRPYSSYVVLRGHHDHLQHFIVSAALGLAGGAGFTAVMGEAKELDDLRRGGQDFSFQDLAADHAGAEFAQIAETPDGARYLETLGNRPKDEGLFFPDVSDLPDSMSPEHFSAAYGDITSPSFKAVLDDIDHRIRTCEAYRAKS